LPMYPVDVPIIGSTRQTSQGNLLYTRLLTWASYHIWYLPCVETLATCRYMHHKPAATHQTHTTDERIDTMTLPEGPVPTSHDGQPIQQPVQPAPQSPYSPYSPPYGAASGYPPLPQGGYTPTDSFVPPATLDPRYGRIGRVPWTL